MRCPEPEAWLAFYGGETDEAATERMANHLQECPACREEFDRLSRFGAGLRGALRAPAAKPRAVRRRPLRPRSTSLVPLAVAAALILAVVGLIVLRPVPPADAPVARTVERPAPLPVEPPPPPPPPPAPPRPTPADDFTLPPPSYKRPTLPPEPEPPPPAPEPPPPVEPRRDETKSAVAIATFGSQPVVDGQALIGRGTVKFPDGTRMDLSDQTSIARISDRAGAGGIGKWIELTEGPLAIEAARQPAGRTMAIATPHGEAHIVGTTLRLAVEKDSTRLDVVEGRVRLSRPGGGSAEVIGGHFAVAADGVELAARPLPKMVVETLLKFGFEDGRMPRMVEAGAVERGPERAGSRFCIAGAMIPGGTAGGHVKLSTDDAKGLFAYADDLVLSFDYWADDSARTLDLHMWSRAQQTTFGTTVWNTPRERWTHQVIPLSDFVRTEPDRLLRMKPGEAVPNLWIQTGQPGAKLYLDNLEIVRMRPSPARKKP